MALDTSNIFERREPTEQDILDIVSPAPSQSSSQYSDEQVAEALKASVAQGFSLEDSLLGAASKFNVPQEQLGRVQNQFFAPTTSQTTPEIIQKQIKQNVSANPFAGQAITTAQGQTYNFDDIVRQIEARYAEGKNPTLAVKSALQLGIPEDVIMALPGVDEAAFRAGKQLITSGAFAPTATGTIADAGAAAAPGTDMYNARIAAGLDAYGRPADEIARLKAAGLYEESTPPPKIISAAPGVTPAAATTTGKTATLADAFNYAQQNLGNRADAISVDVDNFAGAPRSVGAKTQFGDYIITALGNPVYENAVTGYDPETGAELFGQKQVGSDVTGYTIEGISGKTDKGINYEASITVDRAGNITERFVDYKTGSDSGVRVWYDANGKEIDKQGYDRSERWRTPVALGLSFLGSVVGLPGIGEFLSAGALTGASAAALGGAALGAGTAAVGGAEGSDILKGAAVGAASGAVGQGAGQELGKAAGQAVGGDYANIVSGAVKGGVQALPGAIATGDYSQVGIGALTGGATAAGSGAVTEALKEYGIKPTQVQAGINIARAISSGNTNAIIGSLGALTNSSDVNIASKAYIAIDALSKGNPIAATAAIIQLGDAIEAGGKSKVPAVKTADIGGGPFETSAIFEGTEGGGTSEQDFMGLLGTLGDQPGDYPGQEAGPRMFNSSGQMVTAPKGEFLDLPDGRYVDDRGVIFKPDGTPWSPSGQATDPFAATGNIIRGDQKVDVTGEPFRSREDIALDYFYFPEETGKFMGDIGQKIDITGKPIKEDVEDLGQIEVIGKPISDAKDLGKIDIVGKPLKEDVEDLGQIEVVGKPFKEDVEDLGKIDIVGKPIKEDVEDLGKIEIVGKPIKDEPPGVIEGPDVIDIVGKPIKEDVEDLGKIEIVGKPIKEDDTGGKPGTIPRVPTIPTTPTTPTTRPRTPAQRQLAAAPQPSQIPDLPKFESFYYQALKYGPQGARQAMADPTDFQGRMAKTKEAMELAIEGAVNENQAEDAVERVMALSKENPEMTVEGLIDLIGRG